MIPYPGAKFPLFTELPYDIRAIIWHHACEVPREVRVRDKWSECPQRKASKLRWPHQVLKPRTPPPAVLGVCRDSRHIGLRHYEVVERCCGQKDHSGRIIYFNVNADFIRGTVPLGPGTCTRVPVRWFLAVSGEGNVALTRRVEFGPSSTWESLIDDIVCFHDDDIKIWQALQCAFVWDHGQRPRVFEVNGETYRLRC